jgi:cytochrome c peroxidase
VSRTAALAIALLGGVAAAGGCSSGGGGGTGTGTGTGTTGARTGTAAGEGVTLPPAPPLPGVPQGLPPAALPPTVTAELVALGERLFFEPRLGKDGAAACARCHAPPYGTTSEIRTTTLGGKPNLRNTPALINLAWTRALGWDGRHGSLDEAVRAHWKGQLDVAPSIAAIEADPVYRAHFARAGRGPSVDLAVAALAAYVVTRHEGDAPFDRFERGDAAAAPPEAAKGYELFAGKAQCSTCHVPPLYTDDEFHALGLIAQAGEAGDEGRGRLDPARRGAFRTPTLRGAVHTAPYFHDGSAATLEDAIDWHLAGGRGRGAGPDAIDPALVAVTLTADERAQLIAFVRALSPPTPPRGPIAAPGASGGGAP